jgi:hypothetical protein
VWREKICIMAADAARVAASVLRPYQKECVQTCLDLFLTHGVRRQVVSLPVGTGKTVRTVAHTHTRTHTHTQTAAFTHIDTPTATHTHTQGQQLAQRHPHIPSGVRRRVLTRAGSRQTIFSHLLRQVPPPSPHATKTLVLAHREELLDQAARRIAAVNPELVRLTAYTQIDSDRRTQRGISTYIHTHTQCDTRPPHGYRLLTRAREGAPLVGGGCGPRGAASVTAC